MLFEKLNEVEHLTGIFGIISTCTAFLLGIIVLYKAIDTKQKLLFLFFLTVTCTASPWYPSGLGYIYLLITGNTFDYRFYILLGTVLIPIAIHAWLTIYMTIIFPKKKNLVLILYGVIAIIFYIYLFYFLYLAPGAPIENMIGIKRTIIDIDYKGFVLVYLLILIITTIITGIHFSLISMRTDSIVVKWKGKFLLAAFISFGIGAFIDGLLELSIITLIICRLIILFSTLFFYIGFIMPKWMKKIIDLSKA
ncbi:MAG: hypothetical protein ACFE8A_02675 [Candidatus Hodarchaeota archaeon]